MKNNHHILLLIDGIVNVIIGILLLLFPFGIDKTLGLPSSNTYFYPTILGAVILGIGIALLIEAQGKSRNIRGLGLAGAIIINFCGATSLLIWLIIDPFDIPQRGYITLWLIIAIVYIIGFLEVNHNLRKHDSR
ncbi:MAG: hypothetical protein JEZ08_11965 [Clostridiales bacterium]|nr:hypothetical protein [Clostridiales bacterium]